MEQLNKDHSWRMFIVDLVLMAPEKVVRSAAAEQFLLIATRSTNDHNNVKFMVTLLFTVITGLANERAEQSTEYFQLLTRLLAYLATAGVTLNNVHTLLAKEVPDNM